VRYRTRATVALPRPKGLQRIRATLAITMHPRQLVELEQRAAAASMSLTAYVAALLASDGDDVAPRRRDPKINWLEDAPLGELLAQRCMRDVDVDVGRRRGRRVLPCTLPKGHAERCSCVPHRPELEATT
jgi:hypothetical protein